jgi:peroxiredoxin
MAIGLDGAPLKHKIAPPKLSVAEVSASPATVRRHIANGSPMSRMIPTGTTGLRSRTTSTGRARWRRALPDSPPARVRRRRLLLRVGLAVAAILVATAGAAALARRLAETPKVEPPFEQIVDDQTGPIRDFSLGDTAGARHAISDWAGRPAIVLFFIATECPASNGYAPEMARLARRFGSRGVLFWGIHSDPAITPEEAASHAAQYGLDFPILLDPDATVARQTGVRVTPEATVVAPDGQVFYRGRIDDRCTPDGHRRPGAITHDLESALSAVLAGEAPVVTQTKAFGRPLVVPADGGHKGLQKTITFAEHVAPILWKHCAPCHRPGEVAPFSLLSYRDAARRADFLSEVTSSGRMPPWKPHSGAGVFQDAARLSITEIEALRLWAETGCKQGTLPQGSGPPQFTEGWRLGPPDLVLTMPEPYHVAAAGPDIYRSFPVRLPLDREITIRGLELRPGNRRVVHHARVYLDQTGDARRRDLEDQEAGFSTRLGFGGGPELPYPGLGAWTPGMTPRFAREGVGRALPLGSDVVIQIHYHPNGKPEVDQSRVGLYFAREPVTKTMAGYSLCTDQIDIPPGEKRHRILLSTRVKANLHLFTVVPHAHYLCREFRLAATLPDGTTQPLLWITDWDLDWQEQYRYTNPVALPKGTILTLAAYFDNSSDNPRNPNKPPRRVRYGIETHDEMCACHLEFLPDDPGGYAVYKDKSPFGL